MSTPASETNAELAKRAALGLVGYAMAITLVHLGQGVGLILALGQPPMTGFVAQAVVMEFVLACVLGLLGVALYKLPKGEWLFPVGMVVLYIIVERIVAVDPSKLQMWIAPPVASLIVFGIGRALYKLKPAEWLMQRLWAPSSATLLWAGPGAILARAWAWSWAASRFRCTRSWRRTSRF